MSATVYTNVRDSGVLLTVRHLAEPRARRGAEQAIWEGILDAFAEEPDIELAYPTRRMYMAEYGDAPLMAPRPQLLERERPSGDTVGEDTRSG